MALGVMSVACAAGAACVLAACETRFRSTFYEHRTFKTHVRTFKWEIATVIEVNGKLRTNCDRETIRADIIMSYAKCYWPMDLVEPFVQENWCAARARPPRVILDTASRRSRWHRNPPFWFDDAWQARVPRQFVEG